MPEPTNSAPHDLNRRDFLSGMATGAVGGAVLGYGAWQVQQTLTGPLPGQAPLAPPATALAIPGPFPGRVVEVHHPGALSGGRRELYQQWGRPYFYQPRDEQVVADMLSAGMKRLVGCDEAADAWRLFFRRGDRVGIKVVPVGKPDSISSFELIRAIITGLESAGFRRRDVMVFERYRDEFMTCNYHRELPDGVHWECSSAAYDNAQLEIDGQTPGMPKVSHVAGYDRDVYREFGFCMPAPFHNARDDRRYRSHLSTILTRKVDKFISVPVLKDHRSAGVTLSLKNLSHGLVNNVCRSHIAHTVQEWAHNHDGRTLNQCQTFIPGIASLPPIRHKAVLQILDGLVGTYEGGPGNWNSSFATWNYSSLLLATDPVALDHVGWKILDAKRQAEGWPPIAQMGTDASGASVAREKFHSAEQFHARQPQHVPLAETLGLGVFDMRKIQHDRLELG